MLITHIPIFLVWFPYSSKFLRTIIREVNVRTNKVNAKHQVKRDLEMKETRTRLLSRGNVPGIIVLCGPHRDHFLCETFKTAKLLIHSHVFHSLEPIARAIARPCVVFTYRKDSAQLELLLMKSSVRELLDSGQAVFFVKTSREQPLTSSRGILIFKRVNVVKLWCFNQAAQ